MARGLKAGIVGLPNVGKSTLFNALTESKGAQAENFPFCTIEPNVGVVTGAPAAPTPAGLRGGPAHRLTLRAPPRPVAAVPDERLHTLAKISNSKSVVAATVEFVDIAGLVKGASKGEGLGNQFLADIRETDCIVQVVRCFDDDQVRERATSKTARTDTRHAHTLPSPRCAPLMRGSLQWRVAPQRSCRRRSFTWTAAWTRCRTRT